jgi:hypothetical protein
MPYWPLKRPVVDGPGLAKPPEKRKLMPCGMTGQGERRTARGYSNAIGCERPRRTAADF